VVLRCWSVASDYDFHRLR